MYDLNCVFFSEESLDLNFVGDGFWFFFNG